MDGCESRPVRAKGSAENTLDVPWFRYHATLRAHNVLPVIFDWFTNRPAARPIPRPRYSLGNSKDDPPVGTNRTHLVNSIRMHQSRSNGLAGHGVPDLDGILAGAGYDG